MFLYRFARENQANQSIWVFFRIGVRQILIRKVVIIIIDRQQVVVIELFEWLSEKIDIKVLLNVYKCTPFNLPSIP